MVWGGIGKGGVLSVFTITHKNNRVGGGEICLGRNYSLGKGDLMVPSLWNGCFQKLWRL